MTITSVSPSGVLPSQAITAAGNLNADSVANEGRGTSDQPAVIVTLSGNAAAKSSATVAIPPSLDPDKVSQALSDVSGANGFADIYASTNWALIAAKYGDAIAAEDKAGLLEVLETSTGNAGQALSGLGLPVQTLRTSASADPTKSSQVFSVGAFSFTNGGSTYTVTPGKNGALQGTKDGQYWQSWQVSDPNQTNAANSDATAALKTLTTLSGQTSQTNGFSPKVDLSA